MLLNHPEVAHLECKDCQEWIYNIETGEQIKRRGRPQPRAPGQPTPCNRCPKGSPENAERLKLTTANVLTLRLYLRNRATLGCLNDAERSDELLQRNFAILDTTFRAWEMSQNASALALAMDRVPGVD